MCMVDSSGVQPGTLLYTATDILLSQADTLCTRLSLISTIPCKTTVPDGLLPAKTCKAATKRSPPMTHTVDRHVAHMWLVPVMLRVLPDEYEM